MSAPAFTPGPWSLETHHRQGHDRIVPVWYVMASNRVGVAVQPAYSTDEHGEANARLITAAPDLFEALEALDCSDILGVAESCASGQPRWDHVSRKINNARAALAKARIGAAQEEAA